MLDILNRKMKTDFFARTAKKFNHLFRDAQKFLKLFFKLNSVAHSFSKLKIENLDDQQQQQKNRKNWRFAFKIQNGLNYSKD